MTLWKNSCSLSKVATFLCQNHFSVSLPYPFGFHVDCIVLKQMNSFSRLITMSDAYIVWWQSIKRLLWRERQLFSTVVSTLFIYEKPRQIFVSFSVQSRKGICKESLLLPFSTLTFLRLFCHLWLLRVSFVAFEGVICGFWGCHLWPLTLSFAASEPLICHKWEPQSIALTTPKQRFRGSIKCKKNGSCWLSTTFENVNF